MTACDVSYENVMAVNESWGQIKLRKNYEDEFGVLIFTKYVIDHLASLPRSRGHFGLIQLIYGFFSSTTGFWILHLR